MITARYCVAHSHRSFEFRHMGSPSEEAGSTGVAIVSASDFLLLCLCVAAAVSLWKMLARRGRNHERDEINRKGSCHTSTLRRAHSPPPPGQPSPSAKTRSVLVFDEWDGLSAPPIFPACSVCSASFSVAIASSSTCFCASPYFFSGITRVAVFDKPCGKSFSRIMLHLPTRHALQEQIAYCAACVLLPTTAAGDSFTSFSTMSFPHSFSGTLISRNLQSSSTFRTHLA